MYNQRRGLAQASVATDVEARSANFSLMQNKRRQQLEAQLEEKMELLKQYTNPRGIGMRGQTVPPRDVEMLQQQIAQIRQLLDGPGEGQPNTSLPPTPSSGLAVVAHPQTGNAQQQQPAAQMLTQQNVKQLSGQYVLPSAPSSTASTGSKRDAVWQQKYEAWKRKGGSRPESNSIPMLNSAALSAHQPNVFEVNTPGRYSSTSSALQATPAAPVAVAQPWQQPQPQQQQQQQQPVQYGRRATPPNSAQSQGHQFGQQQQPYGQQAQQQQHPWGQAQQFGQQPVGQQGISNNPNSQRATPQQQQQQQSTWAQQPPSGSSQRGTPQQQQQPANQWGQQQPAGYGQQGGYGQQSQQGGYPQQQGHGQPAQQGYGQPVQQQQQQQGYGARRSSGNQQRPW